MRTSWLALVLLAGSISCGSAGTTGTGDGGSGDGGHDGAADQDGAAHDGGTTPDTGVAPDSGPVRDAATVDGPTGTACPPACTSATQFCETTTCGGSGVCLDKGSGICPLIFIPVCGCNNMTYGNDCQRKAAGVAKDHDGACGSADAGTTCTLTPRTNCCFTDAACGSRGSCYNNVCTPLGDGVCKSAPPTGKCWGNRDCLSTQTCVGANICPCGAACLVADSPGNCTGP